MSVQSSATLTDLLAFLERLEEHHIDYRLEHHRPEAIMVNISVPGQRWEVEFLDDGRIEVERFTSSGTIEGGEALEDLFRVHGQ